MNRTGIISALYLEADCITSGKPAAQQPVEINQQTLLIVSGSGLDNASRAAHKLIEEGATCLVSFGCAGALAPELKPGDLVLPEEIQGAGKSYKADAGLHAAARQRLSRKNIPIHTGSMVSTNETVATISAKRELYEQTGAVAVDMETAAVLAAAENSGLPAIALRVITDPADQALPATVLRRVNDFGEVNVPGLAVDLVTSPGQIPALLRLGMANARAVKTMKLIAGELLSPDLSKWLD